jgi:hypothetical protein
MPAHAPQPPEVPEAPDIPVPSAPNFDAPREGLPFIGVPTTDGKGFVVIPWSQDPIIGRAPIPDANGTVAILFMLVDLPSRQSTAHLNAFDVLGNLVYSQTNDLYSDGGPDSTALVYFKAIPTQGVAKLEFSYGSITEGVDVTAPDLGDVPCQPASECLQGCEDNGLCDLGDPCELFKNVPGTCNNQPPDKCDLGNVPIVCGPEPVLCEQPGVRDVPPCKPLPPVCPDGAQSCVCDALALSDFAFLPCGGPDCSPIQECLPNPCDGDTCDIEPCPGHAVTQVAQCVPPVGCDDGTLTESLQRPDHGVHPESLRRLHGLQLLRPAEGVRRARSGLRAVLRHFAGPGAAAVSERLHQAAELQQQSGWPHRLRAAPAVQHVSEADLLRDHHAHAGARATDDGIIRLVEVRYRIMVGPIACL